MPVAVYRYHQVTSNIVSHQSRFNAGLFNVPWEETQAVLEELGVVMTIYEPVDPSTQ